MDDAARPNVDTILRPDFAVDPLLTLSALRLGPLDPQTRIVDGTFMRATWTPAGPASFRLTVAAGGIRVQAWGDGAADIVAELPSMLGAADRPADLGVHHPLVAELAERFHGLRMTRTNRVMETLVPTIIAQKVTGLEAWRAYRDLLARHGERAPGPLGLCLPPRPEVLAGLPYFAYHRLGLERRRADAIRHAAAVARQLEGAARLVPDQARRRLLSLSGVGPWTAAETLRVAMGDPDAVSVGDYNLPALVCYALAGERKGSDEQMLELLAPYAGQRGRVVRLIELSGLRPARRGPRLAPRSVAAM